MSRYQRKQSPTKTYHIMLRGNEKKDIFIDDDDRNRFIETLERMKGNDSYFLYAYCLMSNHVHLLLGESTDSMARTIKRIGVSYAYYFNHKYGRIGHLFQDRFKSEVIDSDSYLLTASRYIHNNPVKAGFVKNPGEYKWSSYNAYVGNCTLNNELIDKELLLYIFTNNKVNAIKHFIDFTNEYSSDTFVDCDESVNTNFSIISDLEIMELVNAILKEHKQDVPGIRYCKDKSLRNMMLREIKDKTGATMRQLSKIMGISKDIIFRA